MNQFFGRVCLWVAICWMPLLSMGGNLKVVVFAVESGDSALILFPTGKTMLVDTGNDAKCNAYVIPFLERHGITKLDYFLETHDHKDHKEGIASLEAAGYIAGSTTKWDNNTYKYEDTFTLEGTEWFISNDPSTGGDANTKSTSFVFKYNGFIYSHGADEGTSSMTRMVSQHPEWHPVNVRNTAHHGYGPNNKGHLEALSAELYIVSCNDGSKSYSSYSTIETAAATVGGDFLLTNEALSNGKDGHIVMEVTSGSDWEYSAVDRSVTIPDFLAGPVSDPNDAAAVSQDIPATLAPGATSSVRVTLKNTGSDTWSTAGDQSLGSQPGGDQTWGLTRVALPHDVAPGQNVDFVFEITAPEVEGVYPFQWQMVDDAAPNQGWFGALTAVSIGVSVPVVPGPNELTNGSFETGDATGWAVNDPSMSSVVSDSKSDGLYSLKLSSVTNIPVTRQVVDLVVNTDYTFTVDVNYPASGTAGAVTARLNVGGVKYKATVSSSTGGWQEQTLSFNSGANISVTLDIYADSGFNGTVYVDNLVLNADEQVLTGYDAWAAEKGVGAAGENADGDDRNNLYEYALNGDPSSSSDGGVNPTLVRSGNILLYTHLQRKNDSDLVYELMTCSDLSIADWSAESVSTGTTSFDVNYDQVTHTFTPGASSSFIRLDIRKP